MHWLVWGFFLGVDLGWGLGAWDDTTQPGHEYSGSWHIILGGSFSRGKPMDCLGSIYPDFCYFWASLTGTGKGTKLVISDNVHILYRVWGVFGTHTGSCFFC